MIEIILGIAGSVIAILLGMIGYFLKNFQKSVEKLKDAVNDLTANAKLEEFKYGIIEGKIEVHEKRICKLEDV